MMREENQTGQKKKGQGDPHEKSKPTRQVDKLALSRGGIGGLLEQRDRDKGEKEHASNPKGRRCQMDPNKNTFKYRHLQYCNEITKCLLQEFPIIGWIECLNFSNFPIPIFQMQGCIEKLKNQGHKSVKTQCPNRLLPCQNYWLYLFGRWLNENDRLHQDEWPSKSDIALQPPTAHQYPKPSYH